MALIKKSPEELAEREERKRHQREEKTRQQEQQRFERDWNAFWSSPAGQARRAFEDGHHVFQCSIDVLNQQAIIVAMRLFRVS